MTGPPPGVSGCGYCLPALRLPAEGPRTEYAIAGAAQQRENEFFTGDGTRRVLSQGEDIEDLMTTACRRALRSVGLAAHDVERLYEYCSVPPYVTRNPLYLLHQRLGLSSGCLVVPINSEYSNFPLGLLHAHEAVAAGGCRNALVVSGSNWTRHLDYAHTAGAWASIRNTFRGTGVRVNTVWELRSSG